MRVDIQFLDTAADVPVASLVRYRLSQVLGVSVVLRSWSKFSSFVGEVCVLGVAMSGGRLVAIVLGAIVIHRLRVTGSSFFVFA